MTTKNRRGPRMKVVHYRSNTLGRTFDVETLCKYGHNAQALERRHKITTDVSRVSCRNCLSVLGSAQRQGVEG